ncbi:MAG: pallilysin-related adhesin [Spirochaetaceae bacterium]|jgi:hypothetical protein|nr:pallilysin-related adhesin [Spirochaetaceae bacterium]
MNRFTLLLSILLLFGCVEKSEIIKPPSDLDMTPVLRDDQNVDYEGQVNSDQNIQEILPLIPIDSNYRVVHIEENNLDGDNEDEQIIITQRQDSQSENQGPLEIWIADFKNGRNEYSLSWRSEIKAEIPETLSILYKNITGNRYDEILVLGFNRDNHQTLDIFYSSGGAVAQYESIFSEDVFGSMEIKYQEQNLQELNQDFGPINIEIHQQNPESENPMDVYYSVWTLNQNSHTFYQSQQRIIAQDDQQQEELRNILQGGEEAFLDHLEGFWYMEKDQVISLLYFDKRENSITFFRGNEMELYENSYIHKGIYSKIYINSINSNIRNTSRNLTITLEDLELISLIVQDNNDSTAMVSPWTGQYKMMNQDLLSDLRLPVQLPMFYEDLQLRGKFRGNLGDELNFGTPPLFSKKQDGKELQGNYSILKQQDRLILELNYLNSRGQRQRLEYYQLDLHEEKDESYVVRSLILTPGRLDIRGFHPTGDRNLSYEQIVVEENQIEN